MNQNEGVKLADKDIEFLWCEWKVRLQKRRVIKELERQEGCEMKEIADYLKHHPITVFPYGFREKYAIKNVKLERDTERNMYFYKKGSVNMYLKKSYTSAFRAKRYCSNILMEQDVESPHCYVSDSFYPEADSVILDIGGAEGIFPIDYLNSAKKIYIFECNEEWVEALKLTYKNYSDKVCIVSKYVSAHSDENSVSLDDFVKENQLEGEPLFIKIDAEGSETAIIEGAKNLLNSKTSIKLAVCTYHCAEHERIFRKRFEGWNIESAKGYMLYYYDFCFSAPYIRRGVLRIDNQSRIE